MVHWIEGRSITILRGEPSTLPDPPVSQPPVPHTPTPEQAAWFAARRAEVAQTRFLTVSATVYDHRETFLRWHDRKSGKSYEGWSNVDFNHLQGIQGFQNAKAFYFQFIGIGNIDTVRLAGRFQRQISIPEHPVLPTDRPGFILTAGEVPGAEALAPIQWLHDYYGAEKVRLAAEYDQREQLRRENPPAAPEASAPRDNVMWFRPRKGSRYLAQPQEVGDR